MEMITSKQNVTLKFNLNMMAWVGMWPLENNNFAFIKHARLLLTSIHVSSQLAAVYVNWGDLEKTATNVCVMLQFIGNLARMCVLMYHRVTLERLLKDLQGYLDDSCQDQDSLEACVECSRRGRALTLIYMSVWVFLGVIWAIIPIIELGSHLNVPPFITWYPFDTSDSPAFEVMYVGQSITAVVSTAFLVAVDMLFLNVILHLSNQFRLLAKTMYNVTEGNSDDILTKDKRVLNKNGTQDTTWKSSEEEISTYNQLKRWINHHRTIIADDKGSSQEFDGVIGPLMLYQFFASTFIICLVGFQTAVTPVGNLNFIRYVAYLMAALLQLFLLCLVGDELIMESTLISQAAYECNWITCSPRFKQSLAFIMLRSQKPVKLTAWKFYVLSLQTFSKVLNASYTYFTLLKQVHERN